MIDEWNYLQEHLNDSRKRLSSLESLRNVQALVALALRVILGLKQPENGANYINGFVIRGGIAG